MTLLYDRVQDKIMQAYGPKSQSLSALDIGAIAYSLRIKVKKIFDEFIADEKIYDHYIKIYMVLSDLLTAIRIDMEDPSEKNNVVRPDIPKMPATITDAHDIVAWHKARSEDPVISAYFKSEKVRKEKFYQRFDALIQKNPAKYECASLDEFCEKVDWNATFRQPIQLTKDFPDLARVNKSVVDFRHTRLLSVFRLAEQYNPDIYYSRMNKMINPEVGPNTEDELYCMMFLLLGYAQALERGHEADDKPIAILQRMHNTMIGSFFNISVVQEFIDLHDQRPKGPQFPMFGPFIDNGVSAHDALIYAVGMCRYYYAFHQDKLTPAQGHNLRSIMMKAYQDVSDLDKAGARTEVYRSDDVFIAKEGADIVRQFSFFAAHEQKPSVENVMETLSSGLSTKEADEMNAILQRTSPYFYLGVSRFVGQDIDIKKQRRLLFNGKKDELGVSEVQREAFVRVVAAYGHQELYDAGFSADDVAYMFQSGKIKNHSSDPKLAWTIDHLVDIQDGGVNEFNNLCIMPSWLNGDKARFLELQTKNVQQGRWVLNLRPHKDETGHYPLIVSADHSTLPEAVSNVFNFPDLKLTRD